jgi:Anti-sigma factor NepR
MMIDQTERLSAYLDGALSPDEASALELELAQNPQLADQLAQLSAADAALRQAFGGVVDEPVPERLSDLLEKPRTAEVYNLAKERAKRAERTKLPARFDWRAGVAIAATLLIGIFSFSQVSEGPGSRGDPIQVALDTTASGTKASLKDGRTLTPRLSFAAADGRYCREFALGVQDGIACNGKEGWKIEALVKGSSGDAAEGGYATAGGSTALDSVYRRLGAGEPVSVAEEKTLISKRWAPAQEK